MTGNAFDYLLVTALDDEAGGLRWALEQVSARGPVRVRVGGAPIVFEWTVDHALGQLRVGTTSLLEMGNEAAADHVRRLMGSFEATYVGFVGIAGAANSDIPAGAVLLADRIWHYEPAKVESHGAVHRGATHTSGRALLERLKYTPLPSVNAAFPSLAPWVEPIVGTIASGDKVVANAAFRDETAKAGRNVVGYEMEGHGFALAIERCLGSERWFMVRGIQDAADKNKSDEYRQLACRRAAAFCVAHMLDSDLVVPRAAGSLAESQPVVADAPAEDVIEPGNVSERGLAYRLAMRLLERDAQALQAELAKGDWRVRLQWAAIEAEAASRSHDVEACFVATGAWDALAKRGDALGESEAVIARLRAWALWKRGSAGEGQALLMSALYRVGDAAERARWTDLAATIQRHENASDWLGAVALYQQAVPVKEHGGDWLGLAITFQNIAFTHAEWLDWRHARYYFRKVLDVAQAREYEGCEASRCIAYLGLAWVDLMAGSVTDMTTAQESLRLAGTEIRSRRVPLELARAAAALALLSKARRGQAVGVPRRTESAFWARLICYQVRVTRGEDVAVLASDLVIQSARTPLAAHRIPALLSTCSPQRTMGQPPSGVDGPSWEVEVGGPWPLSDWLRGTVSTAVDAMRLLEGLASFVAVVLCSAAKEDLHGVPPAAGHMARYVADWASRNPGHVLASEARAVGAILRHSAVRRNQFAHSSPSQDTRRIEAELVAGVRRAIDEMSTLRGARWVSESPPVLLVRDCRIDASEFLSVEGRRVLLTLNGVVVAVGSRGLVEET